MGTPLRSPAVGVDEIEPEKFNSLAWQTGSPLMNWIAASRKQWLRRLTIPLDSHKHKRGATAADESEQVRTAWRGHTSFSAAIYLPCMVIYNVPRSPLRNFSCITTVVESIPNFRAKSDDQIPTQCNGYYSRPPGDADVFFE